MKKSCQHASYKMAIGPQGLFIKNICLLSQRYTVLHKYCIHAYHKVSSLFTAKSSTTGHRYGAYRSRVHRGTASGGRRRLSLPLRGIVSDAYHGGSRLLRRWTKQIAETAEIHHVSYNFNSQNSKCCNSISAVSEKLVAHKGKWEFL